jgi:hypothetical protein
MPDMPLVITTSISTGRALECEARSLAARLGGLYAARRDESLEYLARETGAKRLLIVMPNRLVLYDPVSKLEYFYHPNMVLVRAHNLFRGAHDLFAEAVDLRPGDRHLDATLGFGTEAILAALLVGPSGAVTGLESVPELAEVTRCGMQSFVPSSPRIAEAMRRVDVVTASYRDYLARCATGAYDVVYFDPFFGVHLTGANVAVDPLAAFGNCAPLDMASLREARRVARRRVVVKRTKWAPFPEEPAGESARIVTTRRSRLAYFVYEALPPAPPR